MLEQCPLALVTEDEFGTVQVLKINFTLTANALNPGIGIEHIGCCVALKRQHFVVAKGIATGAVLGQVRIFHRAEAHNLRHLFNELGSFTALF